MSGHTLTFMRLWERIQTGFHANQRAIVESLDEKTRSRRASAANVPPASHSAVAIRMNPRR
jgi:hypothetical protein